MKDLIPVVSSFHAMQAIHQFWREWGVGQTPSERYRQILSNAETQSTFDGLVRASVTMEDWHSGMRSFILHQDDEAAVLDLIAPKINGVRQPQVPLPFQGTLKNPRLVILGSNPQSDRGVLKLPEAAAFDHQVMNLKNISGTWPIPGNFLPDQLTTKGAWVHDNYIDGADALVSAEDVGNARQFGIREIVRLSWFPYRSAKFLSSPFRYFGTGYPEHWLASQKLMLAWLAAYLRRVSKWPTEQQPIFIARQDTKWQRAVHTAITRSDYEDKAELLQLFDARLYYYSSGSAHLTRKNVISAASVTELARVKREYFERGKADFATTLDNIFTQAE